MGKYIWNLYVNRFYTKRNLVLFIILFVAFDSFYVEGLYVGNLKGGLKMGKYIWNLYVNRFYTKRNLVLFIILFVAFDSFYVELDYACKILDYPCSFWYFLNIMTNHFM